MRCLNGLICAGLLSGCVALPPPKPAAGPRFDGVYTGQTVLLRGWGYQCGAPDLPSEVVIQGGQFAYPFQVDPPRVVSVPVQVAADGTFQGGTDYGMYEPMFRRDYRVGHMTVDGRITGGTLEMVESDYRCARRSVLNRR